MTDIVERLRDPARVGRTPARRADIMSEVADEIDRLRTALRIIAGYEQCIDNLMSNVDVARAVLKESER